MGEGYVHVPTLRFIYEQALVLSFRVSDITHRLLRHLWNLVQGIHTASVMRNAIVRKRCNRVESLASERLDIANKLCTLGSKRASLRQRGDSASSRSPQQRATARHVATRPRRHIWNELDASMAVGAGRPRLIIHA